MLNLESAVEKEKQIMKFWKNNKIPLKAKNLRKGKRKWYFLDGPPYATGYIHIGTAWNKILKDTYIRLMRMRGHDVWDQPGYDTHGLPIENKVEQKLGFRSKADIEKLGVKKFNQECRNYVTQFIGIMNDQFWDLGVWMNWDKPYLTLNNEYIEGAWHTFKVGFEKGFLYKDVYSVHVCPHCVDPESTILVDGGTRKIKELANCWEHNKVVSVDTDSKNLVITKPLGYMEHEEDTFLIKTMSGKKLIASSDHPFWTKHQWLPLSQLKHDLEVAVYNNVESFLPKITERGSIILNENKIKGVLESLETLNSEFSALYSYNNLTSASKIKIRNFVHKLRNKNYSYPQIMKVIEDKFKLKVSKSWVSKIFRTDTLTRYDSIIEELNEKELLPLHAKSTKAFILARLVGHLFGDGSIVMKKTENRKFPVFKLVFTGKEVDLKEIQKDLDGLGYGYSPISKVNTESVVNGRPIKGITTSMRCDSSVLAILLISLGAPVGRKTNTNIFVPRWIESNKKLTREFLAAYFGSELDIIKPRKSGKGFDTLRFHMTKEKVLEKNGFEFAEKICELLEKFGITTGKIRIDRKEINGKEKSIFTVSIYCNDSNLIKFAELMGYEYCKERKIRTSLVLGYLMEKRRVGKEQKKLRNKILSLRSSRISCAKIASILNLSELYVRHIVYGKSKNVREAKYMPTFKEWSEKTTENLKDGLFWDKIEKIQYLGKRKVCDIAVDKYHNFITNGFLTHNCETAVAYNEIEYTQLNDPSIYVKFPVKGSDNEYFLIWTTTPWTLPSNTGIMAKPDADYAYVQVEGEVLIMSSNLVEQTLQKTGVKDHRILKTVKGRDLEGKKYVQPLTDVFPFINSLQNAHRVVLSDQYVTLEEGTGLVHTAPGHGQEDYKVGKETGLPIVSPLKMNGTYDHKCGRFSGMLAKHADKEIIDEFNARGLLFHQERITHDYPQCWRCSSPLLFMAVPQWFFKVTKIRDKLIEENRKVQWYPDWAGKRMNNWLQTLGDWPISRQRYWGIPLPIWECNRCGAQRVIGSKDELPKPIPQDFHRPFIDEVLLDCKCGNKMKRISDVLDVWFDAGLSGWASLGYPTNKETLKRLWPSDLQIEGPDQIRGWWNAELITSVITFNEKPFQRILFHGFVLDAHGNKMSKSKGNIVEPKDVVQKHGVDTLRYYLLSSPAWDDFYFNWTDAENVSKTLNILRNSFEFVKTYMTKVPTKKLILKIEDRWILSRLNSLIQEYDAQFNTYNHHKALEKLSDFILNDFSRWYIKLIRDRVWPTYQGKDKDAALFTLFSITENLAKLLAPITPLIAEEVYQNIIRPAKKKFESVHMLDLPIADKKMINKDLEDHMQLAKLMFEASSSARQEAKLKLKWPVKRMLLETNEKRVRIAVKALEKVLLPMCNVKKIEFVRKLPKGKFAEGSFDKYKLYLDLIEDQEIYGERLYRELVREIQEMRKNAKFVVSDEISLTLKSDDETQKVLGKYLKGLVLEVGASKVEIGVLKGKHNGGLIFGKKKVEITFDKMMASKTEKTKKESKPAVSKKNAKGNTQRKRKK